ncbi:hypothetical protein QFW77_06460 [Luteimonas sp. RD2P54]|uniref:DUF1579 domain-containing protein n=1 Tax=Luteimonas endophytica TaxID=3042023 RepID=A0ABT6J7B7_9GAMM|nr:hypothetical protein [Luteimonas endophytica]MDH5822634.1 hypothetical protein [Luteimonas endophytica]
MQEPSEQDDGRHDFDFSHGRWRVGNRRLRARLCGCRDWDQFEARASCRPVLGGLGNTDEFCSAWQGGLLGMTLRLFNPQARQWSIYWASNRAGELEAPVTGGFADGVGTFHGLDRHQGRVVLARFVWSEIGTDSAHWQQALSPDGGVTWETNWHMHFTREAA